MFEDYYICFFDLMGQKEFFAAITSDVLGKGIGHDVERVTSGIKEMVKYVNNRYSKWFSVEDKAGIEIFSDSLLIYVKNSEAVYCNKFSDGIKIYEVKKYIKCININIRFGIIILISMLFYCLNLKGIYQVRICQKPQCFLFHG